MKKFGIHSLHLVLAFGAFGAYSLPALSEVSIYNKQLYFSRTDSYFELVPRNKVRWREAYRLAQNRVYRGRRGRLATVQDQETNNFLRNNFRPVEGAWIGLRYMCSFGILTWGTEEIYPKGAYSNWDREWNHNGSYGEAGLAHGCDGPNDYWPVHYWGVEKGFRWNANSPLKNMPSFFVEYVRE